MDAMPLVECSLTVAPELAGRIDLVVQSLTGKSRAEVRGLFDAQCVQRNGAIVDQPGELVDVGETIAVRYDPHRRYRERPRQQGPHGFTVVHEDDDLLVVEKPAALLTVPTDRGESNTLVDLIARYLGRGRHRTRAFVVHRLDRGTSGLLVFARSPAVAGQLQDQFRARQTDREYVALVAGVVDPPAGTFRSRLATGKSLGRYSTRSPREQGEPAVTHYRTERVLRGVTCVRVWLKTGRRNQIRVHFAEAGHPVLGDERYRPDVARHPQWKARRLALHAATLAFTHPATGHELRFESPLPLEFTRFLRD